VENAETMFTDAYRQGDVLKYHVAHGMGNFVADERTITELESDGRIVFRYVTRSGEFTPEANPNGATHNIAGIINEAGNVLGVMPHPERAVEALLGSTDGVGLFESLRRHIEDGAAISGTPQVAGLR
jgi:phosphoribosylformylglycinamidine synthase